MSQSLSLVDPRLAGGRRRFSSRVERQKLVCRTLGIARDLRLARLQSVAEQKADLDVAADEAEEGAKGGLCVVEGDEPRGTRRLQQRLQALADGDAAVGQDDGAEITLARPGMTDRHAVEGDRGAGG